MTDWLAYGKGFGKGVGNFVKSTAEGVVDLAKGGYRLATDPASREQAYETGKVLAGKASQAVGAAVDDPMGTLDGMRNRAASAWGALQQERAKAAAAGRLEEFDGQLAGRGLSEVASLFVPVSKVAGLGKAAELAGEAGKAGRAVEAGALAGKAIEEGGAQASHVLAAVEECPLKAAAEAEAKAANLSEQIAENAVGKKTQALEETCLGGCPISLATGEELLELEDFRWDGPLPLVWRRFYRSGQSAIDLQLGHGWLTPLDEWLDIAAANIHFHDREGRSIALPLPAPGGYSLNLPARLRLYREDQQYRLLAENGAERIFAADTGRLLAWQNPTGQRIDLVYDAQGKVQLLQASWGKALLIQREAGRIAAIVPARRGGQGWEAAAQPLCTYQYDAQGDLAAALNRLNQGERYAYRNHVIIRRRLASGFSFHFEWDDYTPKGRCLRNTGDHGIYAYRFEWTDSGISRAIDSRGGVTEYMHDANALLLWQTSPEGRRTHYAYDANKRLVSVTDPAGHSTHYAYDEEGRLTTLTDALGQAYQLGYDDQSRPVALTDPLGQTWTRAYDAQGRLLETQDPQGGATRYAYNELGLLAAVTNALGQTRRLLWDTQARLLGETGFDGRQYRYQYDAEDRLLAAIAADTLETRYQYDAVGRLLGVTAADGRATQLEYNAQGLLTRYTDAAGQATEYCYAEGLSQPSERIDPSGQRLRYRYDSERNLIGLINAKDETYTLQYDRDENLIEETGFDGRILRYRYDPAGRLQASARQGAEGWLKTFFERDALGRLVKTNNPDGTSNQFAYDALGRLHAAENAAARLHFHYNALGQIVQESQNDASVAHAYDALGRRSATTAPDGRRIAYEYDAKGWLAAVTLDGQPLSRHRFDELGREIARQQGELVSRYDYDPAGRLKAQYSQRKGGPEPVVRRHYGYDDAGRLALVDDFRHGQSHYLYDPAGRLLQVQGLSVEQFVHDPAGNFIGQSGQSGAAPGDRLKFFGDRHFSYDPAGNLSEERRGREGRLVRRFTYDGDNRLARVEDAQGATTYHYDPLGRRIAKQTAQGETRFVYDGARLLEESGGGRSRLYLFEPGGFKPLACADRTGAANAVYYYHLDHLGTPREMTDAQGRVVWAARYRAYGALALAEVEEIDNPLRFQGQYFDHETGLHYNLNRYYDAEAGRFTQPDPIGLAGGENLFQYAVNPVNWIDPLGLAGKDCGIIESLTVDTPYGPALQSSEASAMAARAQVESGASLYRVGTTGKSQAAEAQFWALEHPSTPGFAQRYGIPAENVQNFNFIESATLKPGTPFVTRPSPPVGANPGGGIEVVVPSGGVNMNWFSYQ